MSKYIIILLIASSISVLSQQEILRFPITHHVMTNSDGSGAIQDIEITLTMQELNKNFLPMGIQFYTCEIDTIKSIKDSSWYYFDERDTINCIFDDILNTSYNPKTINIYYFFRLYNNKGVPFEGSAWSPILASTYSKYGGRDFICLKHWKPHYYALSYVNLLTHLYVPIHEMGHYFGLKHTHENYNNSFNAEHPDAYPNGIGQNMDCLKTGDSLSDTPADISATYYPRGSNGYIVGYFDPVDSCDKCKKNIDSFQTSSYMDSAKIDSLNIKHSQYWWYKPDIHNYMSYTGNCTNRFSEDQKALVRQNAESGIFKYKFGFPFYIKLEITTKGSILPITYSRNLFIGGSDNVYCGIPIPPSDVIYFKDKDGKEDCLIDTNSYNISFPKNMQGLDSAVIYINGDSVKTGMGKDFWGDYYFKLSDYDSLWLDSNFNEIIVEVTIPPDTNKIVFKFKVNCEENPCDGIDEEREQGITNCCVPYYTYHEFFNIKSDKRIIGVEVDSFPTINPIDTGCYAFWYIPIGATAIVTAESFGIDSLGNNYGRIEVGITCFADPPCQKYFDVNYCILFEDSTKCCKTERIVINCKKKPGIILYGNVAPNPTSGTARVDYELSQIPNSQMRITIHNTVGTELLSVYEGIPVSVIGSEPFNISSLPNGAYIVKIIIENEVLEIPISINIIKN